MPSPLRQQTHLLRFKAAGLCILCIILMLVLRRTSLFSNYVELPSYDKMTELTWPWKTGHADMRLITIQNPAIWPLDDSTMAIALEKIATAEPAAVGIDLIRDSYRSNQPNGFDSQRLDLALTPDFILTAEGLPSADTGFQPHPFFRRQRDEVLFSRVGLANFPRDKHFNPPVRRGIISIDQRSRLSLPALTALTALSKQHPEKAGDYVEKLFSRRPMSLTSGGYQLESDQGEQFLIKYGPDLDANFKDHTYALSDVLNMSAEDLKAHFQNKVIFIGTDNASLAKDEIPVIGNSEFRGVKLLALATAQLIRELTTDEKPIRTADDLTEDLILVSVTILACLSALYFASRGIFANITSMILLPSGLILLGCLSLSKGLWLPVAAPAASAICCSIGTLMLVTYHLRKERADIARLLQKQIGPEVADQVWKQNDHLFGDGNTPPETFQGTALFSDLLGYSSITEIFQVQKKGSHIIKWINVYLDTMVAVVKKHHGFIHKFNADGIFVIFGFPTSDNDKHARQALECSWEMLEAVTKLNSEIIGSKENLPKYYARIGIYSGDMHSGLIGSSERFILDFFGSIINKAARLESIDKASFVPADCDSQKPVRILLGKGTLDILDSDQHISLYASEPLKIDSRLPPEYVWQLDDKP